MDLSLIKLLFDFGLLVLICMVQLIVYPSFKFMAGQQLVLWHEKYAKRISIIVVPLMMGQLVLSFFLMTKDVSVPRGVDLFLVISVWIITFTIFVPAHKAIANNKCNTVLLKNLVRKNWYRTLIWSIIFLYNLLLLLNLV